MESARGEPVRGDKWSTCFECGDTRRCRRRPVGHTGHDSERAAWQVHSRMKAAYITF